MQPEPPQPIDRWEVGSEFEWQSLGSGPKYSWPERRSLFALAQHALNALWDDCLARDNVNTLWIPDFFCPPVRSAWEHAGIRIQDYEDDPRWPEPRWSTLQPAKNDVVLAVNFFGVRSGTIWPDWSAAHPRTLLIEDHSHDPCSSWARTSTADYAFASLRKTMPIADGAILWSPAGRPLPGPQRLADTTGSALKLAAMMWKRDYLLDGVVDRQTYRTFQTAGEAAMMRRQRLAISPWSEAFLAAGMPKAWRAQRGINVRAFAERVSDASGFSVLDADAAGDTCPFNAVLIFDDPETRDAAREHLLAARVYPAIHWEQPATAASRVRDLAARILTIPLDQRYRPVDVDRVAGVLLQTPAIHLR